MSYVTRHWDAWEAWEAIDACATKEEAEWEACTTRKPALVRLAKLLNCHRGHSGDSTRDLARHVVATYWAAHEREES